MSELADAMYCPLCDEQVHGLSVDGTYPSREELRNVVRATRKPYVAIQKLVGIVVRVVGAGHSVNDTFDEFREDVADDDDCAAEADEPEC